MQTRFWARTAPIVLCLMLLSGANASAAPSSPTALRTLPRSEVNVAIDRVRHDQQVYAGIVQRQYTLADGHWEHEGPFAVWRLAIRLPGTASIAMHADEVELPSSAVVTLKSDTQERSLTSNAWSKGRLWSLPVNGDTAMIEIRLPKNEQANAHIRIRGFDVTPNDLPTKAHRIELDGVVNYSCVSTPERDLASRATVVLNIAKLQEGAVLICTGTLIGNTRGDDQPLIVTASHCERHAGSPSEPDNRRAYFGAIVPCGSDTVIAASNVATSASDGISVLASFGDTLLYRLDHPVPAGSNAYWMGWDFRSYFEPVQPVPGSSVETPGRRGQFFAINHGGNRPQLFLKDSDGVLGIGGGSVSGVPNPCNGPNGTCSSWTMFSETSLGDGISFGGASGSGLVDQAGHLIGIASMAETKMCYDNGACGSVTFSQQLSDSWLGGGTSTNSFAPWLDPGSTGEMVLEGAEHPTSYMPTLSLSVAPASVTVGQNVTIIWDTTGSIQPCSLSYSRPSGSPMRNSVGETGTLTLTADAAGIYRVNLYCQQPGGSDRPTDVNTEFTAVQVVPPTLSLQLAPITIPQGGVTTVTWSAINANACEAYGAWSGVKSTSGTASTGAIDTVGISTFGMRCNGPGGTIDEARNLLVQSLSNPGESESPGKKGGGSLGLLMLGLFGCGAVYRLRAIRCIDVNCQ